MSIVEGSTSESGSEYSSETEDFQVEFEATSCGVDESASTGTETQNYMEPYAEEPFADEEWLQNYRKEQEEKEDLEEELKLRLDNFVPVSDWWVCCHLFHIVVVWTAPWELEHVFLLGVPVFSVAVIYLETSMNVIVVKNLKAALKR